MSLLTGYIPQAFKVGGLSWSRGFNYSHISNLPFISKILEKAVAKQLCDYLDSNGLLEDLSQDLESITAQTEHY